MRIPWQETSPGYGMHKQKARGAPEIDIVEAMAGNSEVYYDIEHACKYNCTVPDARTMRRLAYRLPMVSTSLQNAPGFPTGADQRPKEECAPILHNGTMQWYEQLDIFHYGAEQSTSYTVTPNYLFWGAEFSGLHWDGPPHVDKPAHLQTDALSANTELSSSHWTDFHTYRVEWRSEDNGFIRWSLDGKLQFMLDSTVLRARKVSFDGVAGGEMKKRVLPREAM
jgi:hypothetical protein